MSYIDHMKKIFKDKFKNPTAFVKTFGCQQNEADSEKICGFLKDIGFNLSYDPLVSDFIVLNTCAVRHSAQNRIYGHIGELKKLKIINSNIFIVVCGCMVEIEEEKRRIFEKYPYVDFICGAKSINKFSELLYESLTKTKVQKDYFMKNLPKNKFKSWIPIISGCDNFCSYCIVPYTRGREVSRNFDEIIDDCKKSISNGSKIITFLGQNVNSYKYGNMNFQDLIREVDKIDGDFIIRFMTSNPKDFTKDLVDTLSSCNHYSRHLHLPVQSGNNRILKLMNRRYTREDYENKIEYARSKISDLVITSDIIVGFPGETNDEFEDTISLVNKIRFHSIFNFIFSPRSGTLASKMIDNISHDEKAKRINKLIDIQNKISEELLSEFKGKSLKVFIEEDTNDIFIGRTSSNLLVKLSKKSGYSIGDQIYAKIIESNRNSLIGKIE